MALTLSLLVWLYFSIFCHELGHFVCAKLVGMSPYLMQVGRGFCISRKWLFGAQIELGVIPVSGMTYAHYPDTNWATFDDLKPKLIIFGIGGCLANSILLVFSITMFVYGSFPVFFQFSVIEASLIIANIIPMDVRLYGLFGMKLANDGKQLLFILTRNYQRYFFAYHQKAITRITGDRAESQTLFKNDIRHLAKII